VSPKRCLRWRHVEVFVFREAQSVVIRARVSYTGLKNNTFDPKKNKTISLRLLPVQLAADNTLRQLLVKVSMEATWVGIFM